MTAGSSRIMHANGIVLSLFSKNTGLIRLSVVDIKMLFSERFNLRMVLRLKGKNGYSHSFDQRIIYDKDNSRFVALELGMRMIESSG